MPGPALHEALTAGLAAGRARIEQALTSGASPSQNGWKLTYHVFDHSLDFFEVGAIDDARWKAVDGPARYLERAAAARGGLWGNHGYEAAYAIGDRTPGLQTAADGSLTLVLQHDEPGTPEARANWLPTPAGTFRPLLRVYEPDDAVFDGRYELPPVVRVG
jgi:hypothetical protein